MIEIGLWAKVFNHAKVFCFTVYDRKDVSILCFQECVPEDYELKKKIFKEIDAVVCQGQILASSTTALPPSEFSADLKNRENCLVAHPVNPPIYCPVIELVPAPWTRTEAMEKARELMLQIGQVRYNVYMNKEQYCEVHFFTRKSNSLRKGHKRRFFPLYRLFFRSYYN